MSSRNLLLFIFLLIVGCKSSKVPSVVEEEFDTFYDRFHTDEQFQMGRILFPLEGGSAQVEGTIPWTRDNWITMKVKIQDINSDTYEVDYHKGIDTFVQSFKLKGTGFGAEYRFRRIKGKWYLVYALDSNL